MVELADIVRLHGPAYLQSRQHCLTAEQLRALTDIATCHTRQMGGVARHCPNCGATQFIGYSCRNRACPRCHGNHATRWLQARSAEMLPVTYYHIVFTVPQSLGALMHTHPKRLLALFMRCCAQTILQMAADPKWIGAQPALLTVLHTARRDLAWHPHVHCVVSGGGYDRIRRHWVAPPKSNFLFPTRVLGRIARQKLLDAIRNTIPQCNLPKAMYKHDWVVHCEGSDHDASHVLRYLARYVFRLPLSNARIVSANDHEVVYSYRPNASPTDKLLRIHPHAFLQRYLQHVLPKGFHAVRYWGLWTIRHRPHLNHLQLRLAPRRSLASHFIRILADQPPDTRTDHPRHCLRCGTVLEHEYLAPVPRYHRTLSPVSTPRSCHDNLANAPP